MAELKQAAGEAVVQAGKAQDMVQRSLSEYDRLDRLNSENMDTAKRCIVTLRQVEDMAGIPHR